MSVQSEVNLPLEERVRRKITWYRVPLMAIATFVIVSLIHDPKAFWYGVPVAVFGELIQMWAASHLHKDKHLTISGPYSHVRNPMYIGRFVLGLGFFIMTWNPYLIGGYVVLFAAYAHMRVNREEERLKEIFKPAYQDTAPRLAGGCRGSSHTPAPSRGGRVGASVREPRGDQHDRAAGGACRGLPADRAVRQTTTCNG